MKTITHIETTKVLDEAQTFDSYGEAESFFTDLQVYLDANTDNKGWYGSVRPTDRSHYNRWNIVIRRSDGGLKGYVKEVQYA